MFSSTSDPELQPFIHSINIIVPATGSWNLNFTQFASEIGGREGGREGEAPKTMGFIKLRH